VDPLTVVDMEFIASTLFPTIDKDIVKKMVAFNNHVSTNLYFPGSFEPAFTQYPTLPNYRANKRNLQSSVCLYWGLLPFGSHTFHIL
jgi:hypothetical protein